MAIEKVKLANLVVEDFEKKIRAGKLKKGDKLPNEIEYARQLGISRLSLREGIQLMRSMGAVTQRPKIGTIVVCDNPDLWIRLPSTQNIMEEGLLNQLTDARVLIESYVTKLFAENASDETIESLREKAEEQIRLSEDLRRSEDYDRYVECDMEFHMIIANGSGNRYLQCSGKYNLAKCNAVIRAELDTLETEIASQIQTMLDEVPEETVEEEKTDTYAAQLAEIDRRADRLIDAFSESADLSPAYLQRALVRRTFNGRWPVWRRNGKSSWRQESATAAGQACRKSWCLKSSALNRRRSLPLSLSEELKWATKRPRSYGRYDLGQPL